MSKASDYKKHSDSMVHFNSVGEQQAFVDRDGNLYLCRHSDFELKRDTGISPEVALAFGKWLVEMFEEKE